MDKSFVKGHAKLERDYGYWPSFHDDIIDKIEISSRNIAFFIHMKTIPEGTASYPIVKLTFYGIRKFSLEGELCGCASIIFDMGSQKIDDYIETQISCSLGTSGTICSKSIEIELV